VGKSNKWEIRIAKSDKGKKRPRKKDLTKSGLLKAIFQTPPAGMA
jgi:hypothetical protein